MFENVWEKIKEHPYFVGGSIAILVVIIYFWYGSGSSSSSGNGIYAYSADPNLIAQQTAEAETTSNNNAQIAMATLGLQATQSTNDAALQAQQSNNASAVQIATLAAKTQFANTAIGSINEMSTHITSSGGGNGGSGNYSQSASGPGTENYKPWLLVFGESLFGNANTADSGTYVGPGGQTVTSASWAKYLGWIGGAQISPTSPNGATLSWDQAQAAAQSHPANGHNAGH